MGSVGFPNRASVDCVSFLRIYFYYLQACNGFSGDAGRLLGICCCWFSRAWVQRLRQLQARYGRIGDSAGCIYICWCLNTKHVVFGHTPAFPYLLSHLDIPGIWRRCDNMWNAAFATSVTLLSMWMSAPCIKLSKRERRRCARWMHDW